MNEGGLSLLSRNQILHSEDRDAFGAILKAHYNARPIRLGVTGDRFSAVANRVDLDGVTLHYCRYEAPVSIDFANAGSFRQFFHLTGRGVIRAARREFAVGDSTRSVVMPGEDFVATYESGYSHLVVQCDEGALTRTSQALLGQDIVPELTAPADTPSEESRVRRLKASAMALSMQFSTETPPHDVLVRELRETLLRCLLVENWPDLVQAAGDRGASEDASAARRLEAYIAANWDKPMTVDDMALACGTSIRSVYSVFQRRRGLTPMAYLRGVRLEEARKLLLQRGAEASVMDVALRCGFASFGHFARRYEERFGELPSATKARRRS